MARPCLVAVLAGDLVKLQGEILVGLDCPGNKGCDFFLVRWGEEIWNILAVMELEELRVEVNKEPGRHLDIMAVANLRADICEATTFPPQRFRRY